MIMQKLTVIEAMQLLARWIDKPCMYIETGDELAFEIECAAPYLDNSDETDCRIIHDGVGIIAFESERLMEEAFEVTVGEDGPTKLNPYDGPARVYALTCNAKGEILNENT